MPYEVIVGNVGRVFESENLFTASKVYGEYKRQSRGSYGRAANEPVTLMADGEPLYEYNPVMVDLELTDTFGGEANYSWVRRECMLLPGKDTDRARVRFAKQWAGWTGIPCEVQKIPDSRDTIAIRPEGICQVLFVMSKELK